MVRTVVSVSRDGWRKYRDSSLVCVLRVKIYCFVGSGRRYERARSTTRERVSLIVAMAEGDKRNGTREIGKRVGSRCQ